jgi:hypothetical protein
MPPRRISAMNVGEVETDSRDKPRLSLPNAHGQRSYRDYARA